MDRPVDLSPGFCICAALALLILPMRWILAWLTASALHELGHYLALKLCGVRIFRIFVSGGGAVMLTETMTPGRELVCAVAGPAVSLLLILFLDKMPLVALCGLIQGLFNLIPVIPFDGGRVVGGLLELWFPDRKEQIMEWLDMCVVLLISALGIWSWVVLKMGPGGILATIFLIQKLHPIKIPCKPAGKGVQ